MPDILEQGGKIRGKNIKGMLPIDSQSNIFTQRKTISASLGGHKTQIRPAVNQQFWGPRSYTGYDKIESVESKIVLLIIIYFWKANVHFSWEL